MFPMIKLRNIVRLYPMSDEAMLTERRFLVGDDIAEQESQADLTQVPTREQNHLKVSLSCYQRDVRSVHEKLACNDQTAGEDEYQVSRGQHNEVEADEAYPVVFGL